ncbi:DsbA family protein [Roseobacter weihaiensis]|uniref:DsbA family protein n=1 Tax=Roseobacter weihaiensis TaxID=2763262 RepID=UPI001D0A9F0B|nr:DsbA family protein [Roseobacter sp. H9]
MRRRDALVIGGAMAVAIAIPPVLRRIPSDFEFEPLNGFEGFRQIKGGSVSGGADPFFGLDQTSIAPEPPADERRISPCLELFGPAGWSDSQLPVAIFSDFNCPYCKLLERRLTDLRDSDGAIRLIWHEMPLLGPASVRSARAVLAARIMGAEAAARDYLSARNLRPGPAALRRMGEALDLDPDRLVAAANGDEVSELLRQSLALGRRLGIPGTPGTVIGRTLVIGAITPPDLTRLIEVERSEVQTICT